MVASKNKDNTSTNTVFIVPFLSALFISNPLFLWLLQCLDFLVIYLYPSTFLDSLIHSYFSPKNFP